jgi:hypothetical protein
LLAGWRLPLLSLMKNSFAKVATNGGKTAEGTEYK